MHSITGIIRVTRELGQGSQVVKAFQLENRMRTNAENAIEAVERLSKRCCASKRA